MGTFISGLFIGAIIGGIYGAIIGIKSFKDNLENRERRKYDTISRF